jgi:CRP/FNR family transcriptional regulator, cyclic AMP receptor protein
MNDPLASLPSLVLLSGAETGRRIPLTTGEKAVLGRSLEADLTFPDEPSLSRFHARIEHEGDHYTITDLGSVNGTQVNGKDIAQQQPTLLSHRDVIACGELELRFELPESQRAAAGSRTMVMTRPDDAESLPRVRAILATENRPSEEEGETGEEAPMSDAAEAEEEPLVAASEAEAETAAHTAPPEDEASASVPTGDAPLEEEDLGAAVAFAEDEDQIPLAPEIELPVEEEREQPLDASMLAEEAEALTAETEDLAHEATSEEVEHAVPFTGMSEEAEVGPVVTLPEAPETAPLPAAEQEPELAPEVEGLAPSAPAERTPLEAAVTALPLFRRLSEEQIQGLVNSMSQREFAPGAEIVRQGEEGLSLYIVLAGEVRVQRAGPGGDLDLAAIGPGGFFGEMTLLDGEPRSATVRAVTPVRCALLPRWGLEATIRANPSVAMEMLAVLSRRLRATEGLLTA